MGSRRGARAARVASLRAADRWAFLIALLIPRVVMVFFGPREHPTIGSEATAVLRGRLIKLPR